LLGFSLIPDECTAAHRNSRGTLYSWWEVRPAARTPSGSVLWYVVKPDIRVLLSKKRVPRLESECRLLRGPQQAAVPFEIT
jgi:hypothetical protein